LINISKEVKESVADYSNEFLLDGINLFEAGL